MKLIETDILVIGAGPAGSSAAKHAAINGADVVMIDKKSEIGSPKRCAEGVSKEGLKKLGIEPSPRWVTRELVVYDLFHQTALMFGSPRNV